LGFMNRELSLKNSPGHLLILSLLLLLLLGACSSNEQRSLSNEEAREALRDSVDTLRQMSSFRMDVTQGGTPYLFYFQIGFTEAVVALTRAEGAFIAPDNLYANAVMSFGNDLINIGLFANSSNQWMRPLALDWLVYEYAPGFNPLDVMGEGTGFNFAIDNLTNVEFVAYETHNGLETIHVHADASRDVVNSLLFGLLYIAEDTATVDFYIDVAKNIPAELILTLPDTSTETSEDTFWQIEIYDLNKPIEIDTPSNVEVVMPEAPEFHEERPWLLPFVWTMGISGIVGAIVTPLIYRRKKRSAANGVVIGAFLGLIGSLIALLPLWFFIPPMSEEDAEEEKAKSEILGQRLNPWLVMAFVAIPVFVGSLDLTVVSAFLPKLVVELGLPLDTGLDDASWVVTIYLLAYTVSLTFTGRLSDLWGRRIVYIASLFIFIFGSIWVAIGLYWPSDLLLTLHRLIGERPDPSQVTLQAIVIGRGIQAFGAGALVPVSLALVGDIFPADKRARPLGFIAAMDTLGWVLGPVYGGIFMQFMPWQGLFWLNVPLSLIALAAVIYALHGVTMHKTRGIFDMLGTVLIVGALAAMTIGLGGNVDPAAATSMDDLQALPPYAGIALSIAGGLFLLFIAVESRLKDPLVNLKMFTRRNLAAAALVNLIVGYCLFIGLVSVPILINLRQQSVDTLSEAALQVGIMLSTLTLPMAFAAVPGGWFSERYGVRQTILFGLLLSITGFLLIWRTWTMDISDLYLGLQMVLVGTGIGLTFSPVSAAIINSATEDERGVAGAIVLILRLIGMTISISTLSSIMLFRVNELVRAAGVTTLDTELITVYTNAAVQVLGEMGLIGALLCIAALIPAFFIDKVVELPAE
jgi:MFS family permease